MGFLATRGRGTRDPDVEGRASVSAAWRDLDVFLVMAGDPRRPGSEAVVDDRQIAIMAILTTGSEAPPARIQSLDPDLGSALRIRT